jgi:hypothetical protein
MGVIQVIGIVIAQMRHRQKTGFQPHMRNLQRCGETRKNSSSGRAVPSPPGMVHADVQRLQSAARITASGHNILVSIETRVRVISPANNMSRQTACGSPVNSSSAVLYEKRTDSAL